MNRISKTILALSKIRQSRAVKMTKCHFDLTKFIYLNGHSVYSVKKCWTISSTDFPITLFIFRNSGIGDVLKPKSVTKAIYGYTTLLGVYLNLEKVFPDTVIQPITFAERVVNLFLHENIKIEKHPVFNKKYQLQSIAKKEIVTLLPSAFIRYLEKYDDIHVEIRGQEFIAYFFRTIEEDDAVTLNGLVEALRSSH